MKLLSQRLLLSRRDLGIEQKELASASGVSNSYISDLERGKVANVGVETVFTLANALGISPAYLLGLTDNPLQGISDEDDSVSSSLPVTSPGTELLGIYQSLSSSNQSLLLTIAQRLKDADSPRVIGNE